MFMKSVSVSEYPTLANNITNNFAVLNNKTNNSKKVIPVTGALTYPLLWYRFGIMNCVSE